LFSAGCMAKEPPREPLSDVVQLTSAFARAGEAYFSPDMQFIVFQAVPVGQQHYQMYLAKLRWKLDRIDGIEPPIRITPENSRNTCGYFSPDGSMLMFASTAGKEQPDQPEGGYQREGRSYRWEFPAGMEIFRADNWRSTIDALGAANQIDLARKPVTNNNVYDAECSFSPDSKWICFTRGAGADADIFVMRPDGSDSVRITTAKGYDGGPFFSPDGKRLVYRSDRKGNDLLQIFVADLAFDPNGKITGLASERQITNDDNVNWGPYWHPDGRHIIFASSLEGHRAYELFLMRDDGSHKTRITTIGGVNILPVFSPDGKWLMWTSKRSGDNTPQLFVARFTMPPSPLSHWERAAVRVAYSRPPISLSGRGPAPTPPLPQGEGRGEGDVPADRRAAFVSQPSRNKTAATRAHESMTYVPFPCYGSGARPL